MYKEKSTFVILVIMVILFSVIINLSVTYAETIILKSRKQVEGKIIEKTDQYIKIDTFGVAVTYWLDEIEKIEEIPVSNQDVLSKSSSKQTNIEAGMNDLLSYFQNKKYESLLIKLNEVKESYPSMPNLYKAFGITYFYLGRFKEAINCFNKDLSLDPNNHLDYLSLWAVYDAIGDRENAKESLLKAIDILRVKEKFHEFMILEAFSKKINEK